MNPTLQTLGQSVDHWQAIYIVSIVVALLSTFAIVVFAFHVQQHKFGLKVSNYVYVVASILAVIATIVIVNRTHSLDAEKDRLVKVATDAADLKIAQANKDAASALSDAATANQKAGEATLKAESTNQANLRLKIELTQHEAQEKGVEAKLAAQNQQTAQFAAGVAQQQQGMAQQMQTTPSLGELQVQQIADQLKLFAGHKVELHMMLDARCQRLGAELETALQRAGITVSASNDVGPIYQGIRVGVKNASPAPHPVFAESLVNAIRSVGIQTGGIAVPSLEDEAVGIYIGPE